MTVVSEDYEQLVQAASAFSPVEPARVLTEFINFTKQFCPYPLGTEADVLEWLSALNRQADLVPVEILAQNWIPYAFHARTNEVSWCLPQGRAVQPFYDEYISHCRQYSVNALISPRTSINALLRYANPLSKLQEPSGFIFHLSRCGSTLLSGCLAEIDICSVLSESPLLTDIVLIDSMTSEEKQALLRICLHLQGGASPQQSHIVVKWNAWDLCYWKMIRDAYPQVPVLFLVRNPVEILASHQRAVGRHMAGDYQLINRIPALQHSMDKTLLHYQIKVLWTLFEIMSDVARNEAIMLLDYSQLTGDRIVEIARYFNVPTSEKETAQIRNRMGFNAKELNKSFIPDSFAKRGMFGSDQLGLIEGELGQLYSALFNIVRGVSMNKTSLPDGLGLRVARDSDRLFIENLFRETREYLYLVNAEKDYLDMVVDQQRQFQLQAYGQQAPNAYTMIIEKQGESIGKIVMDFGANMVHILDLAFIGPARGKGYGKAVLQAMQYVAAQQCLPVGLSVEKQNLPAKKLYLSLGFQVSEETPTHEFLLWYPAVETGRIFVS